MNKKNRIIVLMILVLFSFLTLFFVKDKKDQKQEVVIREKVALQEHESKIEDQKIGEEEIALDLQPLKKKLDDYLKENEIDAQEVGYVVIDLLSGDSIGANEDTYFYAASTYKLPLAMVWYEKINDQEAKLDEELVFLEDTYEEGGHIGTDYEYGSSISIQELLEAMIIESDNSAAHILYENLGGWPAFKKELKKFDPTQRIDEKYISYDNEFTPKNMGNILKYFYSHKDEFEKLLKDLKKSKPGEFLDRNLNVYFPQKYGSYDYSYNAAGINFNTHPYAIVIDTVLGDYGEVVIGDMNEIVYSYFVEQSNE
ncbi:serine hydrolase [Dubosiella newyorkensis]|uniref:serine hydrolase n=3 Tax=Dubosiella newyorkensis TaxID=1862672 RepID=UPI002357A2AB|nr:serine hydrolase [Dubosiella newyorkensis]MCI9041335.1 serine hydrolase [Dubosiella newyorkensis]